MQELEVLTVEPYKVGTFADTSFKHHYVWKGITYKAGEKYLTLQEAKAEQQDDDLAQIVSVWNALHDHLQHEVPQILDEAKDLEDAMNTLKLVSRQDTDKLIKAIKADPRNTSAYYSMRRTMAKELVLQAEQALLMARVQLGNSMKSSLIMLLQSRLRTNLPLYLAEMQTPDGDVEIVAFVWHCPVNKEKVPDPDLCNPNVLRDYTSTALGLLGKEEFTRLWDKFGNTKKLIQVAGAAEQKAMEAQAEKQGKLLRLPTKS